jgi:predicted CXXCH cytochrome family protein
VNCHVAHGSTHAPALKVSIEQSDLLCLQCHGDAAADQPSAAGAVTDAPGSARVRRFDAARLGEHTFHAAESPGSRCVNCHMSEVNWRLLMRRRDHTFKPPVPELTARLGIPNACNTCHDDRTPEWAVAQMDRWYGDGARRRRELGQATAFYEAAEERLEALPALAAILVDRGRDPIARASAAEWMGRLVLKAGGGQPLAQERQGQSQTSFEKAGASPRPRPDTADLASGAASPAAPALTGADARSNASSAVTPAIVNALMGAASDPESAVRMHAVRALGFAGLIRTAPAVTARLVDPARVVRIAAAESLLHLGVVTLPGQVGVALSRAQDEYAASLASFGDTAGDHLALGWLEVQRGRHPEATTALQHALALDPAQLQPRVFLGVIAAREGRYADAVRQWEQVKARAPSWPNIDRLIDEARRRASQGGH